jgi:hypothetical protein
VEDEGLDNGYVVVPIVASFFVTIAVCLFYQQLFGCLIAAQLQHYMKKPRTRWPGETTEIELLRFDRDLEYGSYRGLMDEI